MNTDIKNTNRDIDPVSKLLRRAKPREAAPEDVRARAFEQLHAHWSENVARRKHRQRSVWVGLAATIVVGLGLFTVLNLGQPEAALGSVVATVARIDGNVSVGEVTDGRKSSRLVAGQSLREGDVIETGDSTHVAFAWGQNGSLRLAPNTQVTIEGPHQISLQLGELYYDSKSQPFTKDAISLLTIDTPFGQIAHKGTQFLTSLSDTALVIRVREGHVEVNQRGTVWSTDAGEALRVSATGNTERFKASSRGEEWEWTHGIAPAYNLEGQTAHTLLLWIGRELGYEIEFSDDATNQQTRLLELTGLSSLSPIGALEALPIATNLEYNLQEDVIYISRQ